MEAKAATTKMSVRYAKMQNSFLAVSSMFWGILLQPRDYLSSYLLYGMIALALVGIIGAGIMGNAASLDIPAFTGFAATAGTSKVAASGFLFPALFITIACGAISGFHSLVASGTTSVKSSWNM